jgi:hypothetical protein
MQALESYPGYSGWLPGRTSLQCQGSRMSQSRRAILKFLRAFQMLCQLKQQKMEHYKAVNAALGLAVQQALLQILDWNAFLESFDINADHHKVAHHGTTRCRP